MTTCVLLLGVISCITSGPRPTPAEATHIWTASVPPYVAPPTWPTEPLVVYTGASGPTLGPWTMPVPAPRVRLDGTLLTQPPAVYGVGYRDRGYSRRRR